MDPHLPFLKAIAANPPDDLPRLVYADFLEETGEPVHVARAHFIRTQIALESLTPRTREYREAKALEQRLMEMFLDLWLFDLPEHLRTRDRVTWRRGFPDGIRFGMGISDDWGHVTPDWFTVHPIRRIHVEQVWGVGEIGWADRILWRWITHLRLGPNLVPLVREDGRETEFFIDFMTRPSFAALLSLDLSEDRLTDAWVVQFVSRVEGASFNRTLETLDLSRCYLITDAGANALATVRGLPRLRELRMTDVPISPASITMLRRRFGDGLVI